MNEKDLIAEETAERVTILMRQGLTREEALREEASMILFRKAKRAQVAAILSSLNLIIQTKLDEQIDEVRRLGFIETCFGAVVIHGSRRRGLSEAHWDRIFAVSEIFNEAQRQTPERMTQSARDEARENATYFKNWMVREFKRFKEAGLKCERDE